MPFATPIEHVVVLVFENRSFDHALGASFDFPVGIRNAQPGDLAPNLDPRDGTAYFPTITTAPDGLDDDPGHEPDDVYQQAYGSGYGQPPSGPPNTGFVANFRARYPETRHPDEVLHCLAPEVLPTLSWLAGSFTVCSGWHSAVPGPTWPNRFFIHAGTSRGLFGSPSKQDIIRLIARGDAPFPETVWTWVAQSGLTWKIYEQAPAQSRALKATNIGKSPPSPLPGHNQYRPLLELWRDVADKDGHRLPNLSFIEPLWVGPEQNDMHPGGADPREGDRLVHSVFIAIRNSRYWEKTLLLVLFDEHGGIYDHVPPGPGTSPDDLHCPDPPFSFDRLGLRVPAILASAWTPARVDSTTTYDHTSLIATLRDIFPLSPLPAGLGRRAAAAPSFAHLIGAQAVRTESIAGLIRPTSDPTIYDPAAPISDYQRSLIQLLAAEAAVEQDARLNAALRGNEPDAALRAADRLLQRLDQVDLAVQTQGEAHAALVALLPQLE